MKNIILIILITLVACKNTPFDDKKGSRDASDRGKGITTKVPEPINSNEPSSPTTTKPEVEKLIDKKDFEGMVRAEKNYLLDQKVKLHEEKKKKLNICDIDTVTFEKESCIALLNSLLITTRNVNIVSDHLLSLLLGDSRRSEIEELSDSTYTFYREYKERLKIVSELKQEQ